ncbi:diaminobutyrate acetyltransferase [Paracandidimonas lactea]|uniref:diaminobutyrate acetyltransferase n=1 Tax=Paracandidimonas lactea TaxID=2895524 RepID=UPI001F00F92F
MTTELTINPLEQNPVSAAPDASYGTASAATSPSGSGQTWFRRPRKDDGVAIHQLVSECPPLDLNSRYTYLVLSEHFPATCIVAGEGESLQGYISGYLVPDKSDTLFVWQVAVHPDARGKGLAGQMLRQLLRRPGLRHVRFIETTVGPENRASRALFEGMARSLNTRISESPLFGRSLFGPQGHDDEPLLRIGPFQPL